MQLTYVPGNYYDLYKYHGMIETRRLKNVIFSKQF